jgi:DNA replication licensing factor MCM5
MHEYRLEVNMDHLQTFKAELHDNLRDKPAELMPMFERAAATVYSGMTVGRRNDGAPQPNIQVILTSSCNPTAMRELSAKDYSKLTTVQGIVISASKPKVKATMIKLQCKTCKKSLEIQVKPGLSSVAFPRVCEGTGTENSGGGDKRCPLDPFQVLAEQSTFVDLQTVKIQELPEKVPTGEMPRHMTLTLDRHLVGRVMPGAVISASGIFTILNQKPKMASATSVRLPYLQVLGIAEVTGVGGRMTDSDFTAEEETMFRQMAAMPDLQEKLCKSIAPSIFGHDMIKKALACQLMGGSRKHLPDGARLRGDINVLMLGDPSTAKSQLLKFIEKAAPISVYTSGKGSSAAGLTATVVKDANTNEFFLEGGAMVLADGGVVCIDEFDKMRPEDRVAIHEAMEQQTISIAKAGITTVLNTRTSVLAAANPVFGRYDDMKSAVDNIDFQVPHPPPQPPHTLSLSHLSPNPPPLPQDTSSGVGSVLSGMVRIAHRYGEDG